MRFQILLLPILLLCCVEPAFAQMIEAEPEGPGVMAMILVAVAGVVAGGIAALTIIAPRTKTTVDDKVLAGLVAIAPMLEKIVDPKDPQGVPTPKNPTGLEG